MSQILQHLQSAQQHVYRLALRMLGDHGRAEDLTQDVLTAGWEDRRRLAELENPTGYLLRLTRHRAIDALRSHRARQRREAGSASPDRHHDTPHRRAETNDTLLRIEALIHQLPTDQATVVHLRDVEGMTYQEIEAVTDLSAAQVKTYLHRGRSHLRTLILNAKLYQP